MLLVDDRGECQHRKVDARSKNLSLRVYGNANIQEAVRKWQKAYTEFIIIKPDSSALQDRQRTGSSEQLGVSLICNPSSAALHHLRLCSSFSRVSFCHL